MIRKRVEKLISDVENKSDAVRSQVSYTRLLEYRQD